MMPAQRIISSGCLLLCLWLAQPGLLAADSRKAGDSIYRQMCVKCHGKAGEGVKGKYDDVLYGDWSIEKLTRYIEKNMPEDKPGKCVGADADAVARYIHDTFYSREARAKKQPPRVELARLTNRQYLNTVADLLQHFQGGAPKFLGPEQGLRASYSAARNEKQGDAKVELDRQFLFDFGTNAPAWAPGTTNGFSMRWRGSLLADETGDYEFVIKTPNASRLWLNDDNEPLIDGAVASGDLNEQKATIRLIGGRAYPLRLEFIRAPRDKRGSFSLQWKPPRGTQMAIPARNLSPERAPATYIVTTPFPADDSSLGYERGVQVSPAWDQAATQAAIEAAHHVSKKLDQFARTKPDETNRVAKVEAFCREFAAAAFRRPLTEEQARLFITAQLKRGTLEDAVKRIVLLTLKSPRFLYLGLEGEQPDAYTVAQRLAFGLWDSLPDQALTRAAATGKLETEDQVTAQARRMLNDPRAHAKTQAFLQQWLQMNHSEDLSKDAALFPGFTPEIVSDLRTSLNLFLSDVVWSEKSDYRDLLLADYLFLNDRLAAFYGVKTNGSDGFVKVARPAGERSGVLTHPYLLAEFSYPKSTSPIHRGVFLTRNVIGRALRPPPMAVAFKDAEFAPHMTMREKITELTRSESCQTCHSVINPLGFTLEHYDAVGRFRSSENGRPVDALSDYVTDDGKVVKLTGARDVADFAVASDHSKNRFIEQLFHDVAKQPVLAYDPGLMDRLRLSFVANGCNVQKLLVEIATVTARQGSGKTTSTRKKT